VNEDVHFGSSAAWAIYEMILRLDPDVRAGLKPAPTRNDLTILLLFTDILTGVVSPEFVGNLQFSAYAMKVVAEAVTTAVPGSAGTAVPGTGALKLVGVRLTWEELLALISAGNHILVSIEDRHFVVVTGISGADCSVIAASQAISDCTVTFLENGFLRTITAQEFTARWFSAPNAADPSFGGGAALVEEDALSILGISPNDVRSTKPDVRILKTKDLLKIKGAGWWKKLWRKVKKFFQKVFQAIAKVVKKIAAFITKAFTAAFGKTIGGFLAGIITAPLNFIANTAHYLGQGDFKGLMKYWGSMLIQMAIQAALFFLPGVGQILGGLMQFVGTLFQAAGAFLAAAANVLGHALGSAIGAVVGGILNAGAALLNRIGEGLINYGTKLINQSKDIFSNIKTQGFSYVQDFLKESFVNQLNPLTSYQKLFRSVTDGVTRSASGLSRLITNVTKELGLQMALNKIDQSLEKSKLGSFTKALLSTVANAGLNALGSAFAEGTVPYY
jgi:hypothetical protein